MRSDGDKRIIFIYVFFVIFFLAVSLKILHIQIFRRKFFQNRAQKQYYKLVRLKGTRGDILDRKGRMLATSRQCYSLFANPSIITNPDSIASKLSSVLNLSRGYLLSRLQRNKKFVWIKRKISFNEKEEIDSLSIKGIGFRKEEKRFYPQDTISASVLGIVDIDNKGIDGLELKYNDFLDGKDGWARILQDSMSREVIISSQILTPQKGADIVLSIDAQLQYWTEDYLESTVKKFKAKEGNVVILNANTGEVLALANYPGFNPNDPESFAKGSIKNLALCDMFEPGSVFKVVALVAAVNEEMFLDEDIIFCENGSYKIPGAILDDYRPHGNLSFKEVFVKSSNIGVAKVVKALGLEVYYPYIELLGFGKVTGIDFPGESKGSLKSLNRWSKTSAYIVPMGQEVGVTTLQLASCFAAIVNGGEKVKPHFLLKINSRGVSKKQKYSNERIISQTTAKKVKNILLEVVDSGTGRRAAIKGRKIGGKTGTAQKYDPKIRRYSPTKYRANFVGFVADINPPIIIAISIDEPRKSHLGGVVAAPLFKSIAQKAIKYLEANEI